MCWGKDKSKRWHSETRYPTDIRRENQLFGTPWTHQSGHDPFVFKPHGPTPISVSPSSTVKIRTCVLSGHWKGKQETLKRPGGGDVRRSDLRDAAAFSPRFFHHSPRNGVPAPNRILAWTERQVPVMAAAEASATNSSYRQKARNMRVRVLERAAAAACTWIGGGGYIPWKNYTCPLEFHEKSAYARQKEVRVSARLKHSFYFTPIIRTKYRQCNA